MRSPAVPLAIAALLGAALAADDRVAVMPCAVLAAAAVPCVLVAWTTGIRRVAVFFALLAVTCGMAALGAERRDRALHSELRAVLGHQVGRLPVLTQLTLDEDAALASTGAVTVRGVVRQVFVEGRWVPAAGGVVVRVSGTAGERRLNAWRRGRVIEVPITYGRPFHVFDRGVPDFERQAALDGVALLGSVKSALLVEVRARGSAVDEWAARVRAAVRRRVQRHVGTHSALSAAIVTAVLVGDRSALPAEVRDRLQGAGTYHVIAISGGNVVILAGLVVGLLSLTGGPPRLTSLTAALVLVAHALVVAPGASVERATVVAVAYLMARALEVNTSSWQVLAVAAVYVVGTRPLDVLDAGFVFTFAATAALLTVMPWTTTWSLPRPWIWVATSLVSSIAVDMTLLPASAALLSRVSLAGPVLNLVAVPLMGVVQIAGLVTALPQPIEGLARASGLVAHLAATGIVESARLVDLWPRLNLRVPTPEPWLLGVYYAGLVVFVVVCRNQRWHRARGLAVATVLGAGTWAFVHVPASVPPPSPGHLRLTVLDVGQGDALLLQRADGAAMLVDTGGAPFDGSGTDIGHRVIEPALWARGIRRVDTVVVTHADPDHAGGAAAVVEDLTPRALWLGLPVAAPTRIDEVLEAARWWDVPVRQVRAGERVAWGNVSMRVLNPPVPDWERRRVRNDDSVVLEVLYGDVAFLLTGDIGADVERAIVPSLRPAAVRVLKVAHHGSRTSTSPELLAAWRPQVGVVSAGRNNPFGHPAPEVVARLQAAGVRLFRTDQDGEVTIETDGRGVSVSTYSAARFTCCQRASSSSSVASWR